MKPVLALLKKEFLFSKWCILFIVLINLVLGLCYAFFPAFTTGRFSLLSFTLLSFFSVYMTLVALTSLEEKFPKAQAGLCCAPYSRTKLVMVRYLYPVCTYLLVLLMHGLFRLVLPAGMLTGPQLCLSLLVNTVVICVFVPLNYRFTPQAATWGVLMAYCAVIMPLHDSALRARLALALSGFTGLPLAALAGLLLAALAAVFALSSLASIQLYQKKEL